MSDSNSERCKACDSLFTTHFNEEHNCFEDMCSHCRYLALKGEDDGILYDDYSEWADLVEQLNGQVLV